MTNERVMVAMEKFGKQIPDFGQVELKKRLSEAEDECMDELMFMPMKGKVKTLMFSIFLGGIAVDRFYVGDTGVAVFKLIFGILSTILSFVPVLGIILSLARGIWSFVDIFVCYKKAKSINFNNLIMFLNRHKKREEK